MSLLNLKSRDAEIFKCLEDTSKKLGYEAIEDLKKFVNEKYLPQTKYSSMLTPQEFFIVQMGTRGDWIGVGRNSAPSTR